MLVTPYASDGTLGSTTYDIYAIVGDTLTLTPEDPETNEIPHEFSDSPLDTSVTMGTVTLEAECLDFQSIIMQTLYGCTVVDGVVVFPASYQDLYCFVRIKFEDRDFVLPYVKMNSKDTLESMRSDIARGTISGTLLAKQVAIAPLGSSPTSVAEDHIFTTTRLWVPTGQDIFVVQNGSYVTDEKDTDTSSLIIVNVGAYVGTASAGASAVATPAAGVVTGAGSYNSGDAVLVTASANDGYTFLGFTDDSGTRLDGQETDGVYAFAASANVNIRAIFSEN